MTHSVSAESEPSSELYHHTSTPDLQNGLDLFFRRIFPPPESSPSDGGESDEIRTMPESGSLEDRPFDFERRSSLSSEKFLIEENLYLRRVCSENALMIERLESDKQELSEQLRYSQILNEQYFHDKTELVQRIVQLEKKLKIKKTRHLPSSKHNKKRRSSLSSRSVQLENKFIEFKQQQASDKQRRKCKPQTNPISSKDVSIPDDDCNTLQVGDIECSSSQALHCVNVINRPKDFLGLYFDSTLQTGVVVQLIVPGSVADHAHIQVGDVIIEICGLNVRNANYIIAIKIINDCHEDKIQFRLLRHQPEGSLSSISTSIQKTVSLRRRDAFLNRRPIQRNFYGRQYAKDLLLYQNANITLSVPRKIYLHHSLEKIQLLGGNAVGIFVHSITDEGLANCLQTGDQLLEYNNVDLTQATAEDAAIELARPVRESVIVAWFNLDGYNHIQESSLGDSFYIRAEFSRASINRSLEFKKGEILYVDNTLHDGKPGCWRAWKVNEFGEKIACGVIPSKYNAENEIQLAQQDYSRNKFRRFNLLTLFRSLGILFRRPSTRLNSNRYHKLIPIEESPNEKTADRKSQDKVIVLASFTSENTAKDCNNNNHHAKGEHYSDESCPKHSPKTESNHAKLELDKRSSISSDASSSLSYCRVRKVQVESPRPVIIFGPYSYLLVERLVSNYPQIFKECKREFTTISEVQKIYSSTQNRHNNSASWSFESIHNCITQGLHPVLEGVENCLEQLRAQQLFPIVIGLRFKSPRHIKETVNKWTDSHNRPLGGKRISNNHAKSYFKHQKQLELDWDENVHQFVGGNNHSYMCTRIKQIVESEQAKVIWQ